ncbi:MAG: D-tyrosyl-tRNA(Tyr) deacylase [Bacteroidetes Order II. Incertae sedis bacterium]|nr:D-tyrosyl-tRNA(Tyr) deacylase [Bacteroidetes Order II. bacterium]MBT4052452.1 D-tyrosyl-tRNA(Tyr) deacylase [Bacteroidetes Order II. bacterium]MBT4602394.1 D-tyrosyl-tRNA(Tyr) deacylase [Bacteroidetes Order II. bacterium]MBT5248927.1 D-tyrosyl-tRNA(Tyr) deacylase [Bacteroidetes Order II. bacterium]MBT6200898.1 D-tyrosyl-tRNA(Tyr) deacylase [Bacteroidetes Order II. bacterium]
MKVLIQRVKRAQVTVDGRSTGSIKEGLLILLGVHTTDTSSLIPWLVGKCVHLRIFPDDAGKMNRSVLDHGGDILVVSQFTLYGNAAKGNRPSFIESARPELAEPLYESFCEQCADFLGKPIQTGEFGAMMDVELLNWGPVTLDIEKRNS